MDKSNFTRNENQIALFSDTNELLAEITFPYIDEQTVDVNHTFVDSSLRGQGNSGRRARSTKLKGSTDLFLCTELV